MTKGRRDKWVQVRLDEREHTTITRLAEDYDMDISSFVRAMVVYFNTYRPALLIPHVGKGYAPTTYTMPLSASSKTWMRRSASVR